jgi:hypothetical protein
MQSVAWGLGAAGVAVLSRADSGDTVGTMRVLHWPGQPLNTTIPSMECRRLLGGTSKREPYMAQFSRLCCGQRLAGLQNELKLVWRPRFPNTYHLHP